ncbi:MAG: signal peptidase II [Bacilli bacterium]|nr:signal peptidase II [Bacilli bacterium]
MNKKLADFFTKEKIKAFFLSLIKSPLFYITLFAIFADILSKWCVQLNVSVGVPITIIPNFLEISLLYNKGALWGMGSDSIAARIVLIIIRLILAFLIPVVYLLKGQELKMRYKVTIMLIYAGCIGNLIDGLFYWEPVVGFDGVIDWIHFTFFSPSFNLADSYVTVCVFLIIIFIIVDEIKEAIRRNRRGEFSMTPEEYEKKMKEEKHETNHSKK